MPEPCLEIGDGEGKAASVGDPSGVPVVGAGVLTGTPCRTAAPPNRSLLHVLSRNEFGKAVLRLVVVQKRQFLLVELLEERLPTDFLQRIRAAKARVIDPQQSGLVTLFHGALYCSRVPAPLLHPAANLVVIGC